MELISLQLIYEFHLSGNAYFPISINLFALKNRSRVPLPFTRARENVTSIVIKPTTGNFLKYFVN